MALPLPRPAAPARAEGVEVMTKITQDIEDDIAEDEEEFEEMYLQL